MTYHEIASRTYLVKNPPRQLGLLKRLTCLAIGISLLAGVVTLVLRSLS